MKDLSEIIIEILEDSYDQFRGLSVGFDQLGDDYNYRVSEAILRAIETANEVKE